MKSQTGRVPLSQIRENPLAKEIFRKLSEEQYLALREDVRKHGQRKPLDVNKDFVLLSGHDVLRAMRELRAETVEVRLVELQDVGQEDEHLIHDNILTRILSPMEIARAGLHLEHVAKRYAKPGRPVRDIVTGTLGISTMQYLKAKAVLLSSDTSLIERVDRGELSVARAFAMLKTEGERTQAARENPRFRLVNEDPMSILGNLRPESADCVVAHPPQDLNPVWADLVFRALKPNASLFILTQWNIPAVAEAIQAGLCMAAPPIALISRAQQEGGFTHNHTLVTWLSKGEKPKSSIRMDRLSTIWDMRMSPTPMAEAFGRIIEMATELSDIVVHLYGDNRELSELSEEMGRNILSIQPDRDKYLREKMHV